MSEKDIVELLPCPFCGEPLQIRQLFYDRDFREQPPKNIAWHSGVVASDSPCIFSGKGFYESEWAKWNTRTPNMVLSEALARAEEVSAFVSRQREEPYVPSGSELNAVEDLVVAVKQL